MVGVGLGKSLDEITLKLDTQMVHIITILDKTSILFTVSVSCSFDSADKLKFICSPLRAMSITHSFVSSIVTIIISRNSQCQR